MNQPQKQEQKYTHPLIQALNEKQVNTLYSLAPIRKLEAGQVFIKQGDAAQVFYLILDGEIRVVRDLKGHVETVETLGRGDWVGAFPFTEQMSRKASAITNVPSTVMAVEKSAFETLDEKAQLILFQQLTEKSAERIKKLETRETELVAKNRRLRNALFAVHSDSKVDYTGSEKIQAIIKRIPRLPVFAQSLLTRLFEEQGSAKAITEMVKQDPALMGLIMKTINSAYYGFRGKISDVHRAIVLLGNNGLYRLIMTEGVRRTMPDKPVYREIHAHAIAVSHISHVISLQAKIGKPSEISTIGLLHDLGKAVIELLKEQNAGFAFLLDSLDPARIGSMLLRNWNLPEVVWKTVEFQRFPEFSPPSGVPSEFQINVALLCMAHGCCCILEGLKEQDVPIPFFDEYQRLLGWENLSLSQITHEIVLPGLSKHMKALPDSFRKLLKQASENTGITS